MYSSPNTGSSSGGGRVLKKQALNATEWHMNPYPTPFFVTLQATHDLECQLSQLLPPPPAPPPPPPLQILVFFQYIQGWEQFISKQTLSHK